MVDSTQRARSLRQTAPFPEKLLWDAIRGRKVGGLKFRRQHPIGGFFADFACVEARLVVELDGRFHDDQIERDEVRTAEIERCGFHVLRFRNEEVTQRLDEVLKRILAEVRTFRSLDPHPPSHAGARPGPSLSRSGEGTMNPYFDPARFRRRRGA